MYARWIPYLLLLQQKNVRVEVCQYLTEHLANDVDHFDEMWIYCYYSTFKQQTSEWVPQGSPCPLKPCAMESKMKSMVIAFFEQKAWYTYL